MDKDYKLRYLPLFKDDLEKTLLYIADVLKNPQSAAKLIDDVEDAIRNRLQYPLAFEKMATLTHRL